MNIRNHRCGLHRTLKAIQNGTLTIGFVGGSITDGRVPYNWPEPVAAWFVRQFPGLRLQVENAAIGATGSELAVFRARRDLIDRGCDLVFIEYAVNDSGEPPVRRRRTREGLIRKLMAGQGRDLALVHTFGQNMYEEMMQDRMPDTVRDLEELAEHYGIGSVWMGLHALNEVRAGQMRWEEWLPDGVHPQYRGSLAYAESVNRFLEHELVSSPGEMPLPAGPQLPRPLDPENWEHAHALPLSEVELSGPWTTRRHLSMIWMDRLLDTAAVGARLAFEFEGTALTLGFDFGRTSSEFKYRLDGGDWTPVVRERPDWCGDSGWYRLTSIADNLPRHRHRVEIEVTHGNAPNCTGTNFRLGLIGVVP